MKEPDAECMSKIDARHMLKRELAKLVIDGARIINGGLLWMERSRRVLCGGLSADMFRPVFERSNKPYEILC